MKKDDSFKKIADRIPLKTKLKVSNEMAFITLLSELGYREDKMWASKEDKILSKLMKYAEKHTAYQLKIIKEASKKKK